MQTYQLLITEGQRKILMNALVSAKCSTKPTASGDETSYDAESEEARILIDMVGTLVR
jgi:hypothetical protein